MVLLFIYSGPHFLNTSLSARGFYLILSLQDTENAGLEVFQRTQQLASWIFRKGATFSPDGWIVPKRAIFAR